MAKKIVSVDIIDCCNDCGYRYMWSCDHEDYKSKDRSLPKVIKIPIPQFCPLPDADD